ncbi:MAG: thiamine phosphate synthase [Acidobacteriota bacterium]|nr:thiamine phosphate synthase [Acidobacteriota bacterium]
MSFNPQRPLLYLITSGETTVETTPATKDFSRILSLIEAAVASRMDLLQIREKNLSANVLYKLSASAAAITRGSETKLLVNDRSDIAASAGADGVHLATYSLPADVVRRTFGPEFLIGVSTHSLAQATAAHSGGADFVVFGPVFDTQSKRQYGKPQGPAELARVTSKLSPFPVIALGGLTTDNVADCIRAGAQGIAAIRMFSDPVQLDRVVNAIRENFEQR